MVETPRSLIDAAYAAALDDSWEAWSERLIAALGGAGGSFTVMNHATGAVHRSVLHSPRSRALDDYAAGYWALDPQLPFACIARAPTVYLDTDHVDHEDPRTAEYMAWLRGAIGLDHHMTALTRLAGSPLTVGVSVLRAVADGHTPPAEQARLRAMLPEIGHALQLGLRHADLLLDSYWEGVAAVAGERAALLLEERGRVLRATPTALALMRLDDGLGIVGGRPRCTMPGDDARLAAIVARALADPPRAGAVRAARRSGRAAFVVTAFPLTRRRRLLAPAEAAALVTIVDPLAAAGSAPLYAEAFGLTPRETAFAGLLMAGHSIESAAATLTLAMPTARLHLRRLLAKTGTSRQAELVRVLGRVG